MNVLLTDEEMKREVAEQRRVLELVCHRPTTLDGRQAIAKAQHKRSYTAGKRDLLAWLEAGLTPHLCAVEGWFLTPEGLEALRRKVGLEGGE